MSLCNSIGSCAQYQQQDKGKKTKCRGDRKAQRYRRQLYDRGLSYEQVEKLAKEKFPSHIHQQQRLQDFKEMTRTDQYNTQKNPVCIPLHQV